MRLGIADARQVRERLGGRRALEVQLDTAGRVRLQLADVGDRRQVPLADYPDPVANALHLRHHVGAEEDRGAPRALLRDERVERLLHQGVQALGRLIQDQQVRTVHEGLDQTHLLLVAMRELADLPRQIKAQALGELVYPRAFDPSPDRSEVTQILGSG